MAQPKPSPLSSLLARKGSARPAMRPQDLSSPATDRAEDGSLDDLGWNDLGELVPPVLVERRSLKVEIERSVERLPVSPATVARIDRKPVGSTTRSKVAFTVRIDGDQHLRLRHVAAITGTSSQHIVTQALDAFLQTLPGVDAHVAQPRLSKSKC